MKGKNTRKRKPALTMPGRQASKAARQATKEAGNETESTNQASSQRSGEVECVNKALDIPHESPDRRARDPNHTQNSLLCTIASMHGRFLSIICAVLFAFYMYYYQQAETCRLKLNDLRLRVARTMIIPAYHDPCGINVEDYFDANGLDIRKTVEAFYDQLGYNPDTRIQAILSESGLDVAATFQYDQRVSRLLGLINLVANIYPYSTRSRKTSPGIASVMYSDLQKDWTLEWQRDLGSLNFELTMLWQRRRVAIEDLIRRYSEANVKDEANPRSDSLGQNRDLRRMVVSTFTETIERFFNTVVQMNQDILPELNDYSFRLARYQALRLDKATLINTLSPISLVLLFGVVVPLFLSLRPVRSIRVSCGILILSIAPYIWLLLFLVLGTLRVTS